MAGLTVTLADRPGKPSAQTGAGARPARDLAKPAASAYTARGSAFLAAVAANLLLRCGGNTLQLLGELCAAHRHHVQIGGENGVRGFRRTPGELHGLVTKDFGGVFVAIAQIGISNRVGGIRP